MNLKFTVPNSYKRVLLAIVFIALPVVTAEAQCLPLQAGHLLPKTNVSGGGFGGSVAISSTTAIVGSPQLGYIVSGDATGKADLFDAVTGQHIRQLVADGFGISVAIAGTTVVLGASREDIDGVGGNRGAVYIFDVSTGTQTHKLLAGLRRLTRS